MFTEESFDNKPRIYQVVASFFGNRSTETVTQQEVISSQHELKKDQNLWKGKNLYLAFWYYNRTLTTTL